MALERRGVKVGPRERLDRRPAGIDGWMDRSGWLDAPGSAVQRAVLRAFGSAGKAGASLKDLLHGTRPLGHPLHPALVHLPIGAFTVMVIADWLGIAGLVPSEVGPLCLIIGIAGMLAAAASGLADYTGTSGKEQRYATVHGALMTLVLVAMIVSLVLRYQPSATLFFEGVLLSTAGLGVLAGAAYLGGHLSYGMGTMVNRTAFQEGVRQWTEVGASADFAEGRLVRVTAGDMPVLVTRLGGRLNAIAATCSHAGGPLDEGTLEGDLVTCPWHGSRFCVADGHVESGPATFPQPALLVVEEEGRVRLRRP